MICKICGTDWQRSGMPCCEDCFMAQILRGDEE